MASKDGTETDLEPQAASESISRCLDVLQGKKDDLARALVEAGCITELIYSVYSKNLISQQQAQYILGNSMLPIEQCTNFLEMICNNIGIISDCNGTVAAQNSGTLQSKAEAVRELIVSLLEVKLHYIASLLHPVFTKHYSTSKSGGPYLYESSIEEDRFFLGPSNNDNKGYSSAATGEHLASGSEDGACGVGAASYGGNSGGVTNYNVMDNNNGGNRSVNSIRESASYPSLDVRYGDERVVAAAASRERQQREMRPSASEGDRLDSKAFLNSKIRVVINDEIHGPMDGEDSDDEIYRNCSKPRGLVFLANFSFKDSKEHEHRAGSEIDVINLQALFTQMGYCIPDVHRDLTARETTKALRKFRDDPRHEDVHSCVVIIMSHGKDSDAFYASDNRAVSTNDVMELFNNRSCPALKGKPKIFILQYCRGEIMDAGVPQLMPVAGARGYKVQTDAAAYGLSPQILKVGTYSDMIKVYSTVEGYASFRNIERGAWLVKALCSVFMSGACQEHIDHLLKVVSNRVSSFESSDGYKQTCEIQSKNFRKYFYFNPCRMFPGMDELVNALPSDEDTGNSINTSNSDNRRRNRSNSYRDPPSSPRPRSFTISPGHSNWSLNSPRTSRHYEATSSTAFPYNSSANNSCENLSGLQVNTYNTSASGGMPTLESQHSQNNYSTGARGRRYSAEPSPSTELNLSGMLQEGAVLLHPRLESITGKKKRLSDSFDPPLTFFQPSLLDEDDNKNSITTGNVESICSLNVSTGGHSRPETPNSGLDTVDFHLNNISNRSTDHEYNNGETVIPGEANGNASPFPYQKPHYTAVARSSQPSDEYHRHQFSASPANSAIPAVNQLSTTTLPPQRPSLDLIPGRYQSQSEPASFDVLGDPSPVTSSASPSPDYKDNSPSVGRNFALHELSHRRYRREKSMELGTASRGQAAAATGAGFSIKRQLSMQSEKELLGHLKDLRTYVQIDESEPRMLKYIDSLSRHVKSKSYNKKRKKDSSHSQD